MKTNAITILLAAMFGASSAMAAECLRLPETVPSPDAELEAITHEASWDELLEELTEADRLVVVSAEVGDKIVLDPGFKVVNVEVADLWITDVEIARRGKGVVIYPTQVGVTRLFVADAEGWVLEYELKVEEGVESAELKAYEVDETIETGIASIE